MITPHDIRSAYEVLGLPDGASLDEVQAAYRELAQILHPDRYATNVHLRERAQEQFKRVNAARDLLVDHLAPGRGPRSNRQHGGGRAGAASRPRQPEPPARPPTMRERALELRARATAIEVGVRTLRDREDDAKSMRYQGLDTIGGAIGCTLLATFGFSLLLGALTFLFFGWWALLIGARDALRAHFDLSRLRDARRELEAEIAVLLAEANELDRQSSLIESGQPPAPPEEEPAPEGGRVPDFVAAAPPARRRKWAWAAVTVAVATGVGFMAFHYANDLIAERQAIAAWDRMQQAYRKGSLTAVEESFDFQAFGESQARWVVNSRNTTGLEARLADESRRRVRDSLVHPQRESQYNELLSAGRVVRAERTHPDRCLVDLRLSDGAEGYASVERDQDGDVWRIAWIQPPEDYERLDY